MGVRFNYLNVYVVCIMYVVINNGNGLLPIFGLVIICIIYILSIHPALFTAGLVVLKM